MNDFLSQRSTYSASASLSGYLFQCRYALLEALRRLKRQVDFSISVETLDDVVFETDADIIEILQTKHHLGKATNLSDASPDLWKTIRIWCDFFNNSAFSPETLFYLVTTSSTSENSIANYLTSGTNRDITAAITRLNSVAISSTNSENTLAYESYRSLSDEKKRKLFEAVVVFDSTPTLLEIDNDIKQELYFAVEYKYLDAFMKRLEGWWFRRVIKQISLVDVEPILSVEISEELTYIRDQFKEDNLPVDDDILLSAINDSDFYDRMFVQQLHLINISDKRIFYAIRDYFRAFTQRSRWLRDDLLYVGELDRYERRLLEEWEIHFEGMREDIGDAATDNEKEKAAKALYKWVEQGNLAQIRSCITEPSIPRGSYHILADEIKLGWHIEFAERLKVLLEV